MFATTNYTKPFTITAQVPEITDGTNLYVGTYQIVTPTGGTNPVVNLAPNNYLLSFTDAKWSLRFSVPNSAAPLNVLHLITHGLTGYTNWSGGFSGSGFSLGSAVSGSNGEAAVWMLGVAADGTAVSNAVPVSGSSTSSNNFVGSLNAGQVYGLGTVASLNSNAVLGMAGAVIAGSNYVTVGALAASNSYTGTFSGNGAALTNLSEQALVGGWTNNGRAYYYAGGALGSGWLINTNFVSGAFSATDTNFNYIGTANGFTYGRSTASNYTATAIPGFNGDGSGLTGAPYLTGTYFSGMQVGSFAGAFWMGSTLANSVVSENSGGLIASAGIQTSNNVDLHVAGTYYGNGSGLTGLSSNNFSGHLAASQVDAPGGGSIITTVSSNTFSGSLNMGQVYGLGNVSGLSSNQVIGMAVGSVAGGSATNAIGLNGGTGTNINLTKITTVDQLPTLYATPTFAIFYGDSITQGNYVTNGYCADLANMGFQHFTVEDFGISSSHLTDVSNLFWGSSYSGSRAYTNWLGHAGSNYWMSFWIGINDCLYDATPLDTNTWIASYTNMWWTAHVNGASPVVVFTIEDSLQLSASGEANRSLLNSLITQNALADNGWVVLMNNDLILPSTNATYFLYNPAANYGLHPTDYGHSLVAQALAAQMVLGTNLSRGAYFNGPVWSTSGFGGNGSNLLNVPVTLGNGVNGMNTSAAVGMLGVDGSGRVTSNAVPTSSGSTSSNNFVGSLNVGQVYGLGNAVTLSSNVLVNMATNGLGSAAHSAATAFDAAGAAAASAQAVTNGYPWGSLYDAAGAAQRSTNALASGAFTTVGNSATLSSNQIIAMASATGGAATNLALGVLATGSNSATAVWMLGIDVSGRTTSNAVPTTGASTSSNNFVGSLNVGQVYGLGTVAGLSSNTVLGMAGALITPGPITTAGTNVIVTPSTNATTGQISYVVAASGNGSGSGNGGGGGVASGASVTNVNLTGKTALDQKPVPYGTPTVGLFYGDTITKGSYVTNGYVADLGNYGWQNFSVANNAVSSSKLTDVSNAFYGFSYSGGYAYSNWVGKAGTNSFVSFWVGINDATFDPFPIDTNTWIASYTNLWWAAHTNGANPVVVFTIEDSIQLSATGETNRALLNSLIAQNAAADSPWLVLLNNDYILVNTNSTYFLYNGTAGYGVIPNDYGQSLEAQALAGQLMNGTNLPAGAYFSGPVWAAGGLGGSGSNLFNLPASKLTGVIPTANMPVNTIVTVGSGLTVASNSAGGVQTYTVAAGTVAATPAWLTQRVWSYGPNGSGTTLYTLGMSGSTSGALASQAETATDPYCINLSTTSTAGNYSSIGDNQKTLNMAKATTLSWRVGLTNTANIRVWMALSDAATLATGDTSRQCVGFLYSSTNSNTDWQFCTQNGTGHTWTDTGIAADLNSHTFTTTWDGVANAYGYIDGNCVATNSTYLPTSYQWGQWLEVTALANATVGVRFVQFYGQQGF